MMGAQKKDTLCIIPARGGSKGIPRKNIKLVAGNPLVSYAITAALKSTLVSRVIVSTDDKEIAHIAQQCGAEIPFLRSAKLAKDDVHSVFVVLDALDKLEEIEGYIPDVVMMLLPTAPLITAKYVDEALGLCFQKKQGSVISVCPFELPISERYRCQAARLYQRMLHIFLCRPG